jgi:hypothetical protein
MKIIIFTFAFILAGCANDMPIVSPKMLGAGEKPIPKDLKILFANGDPTKSKISQIKDNFVSVQNLTIDATVLYQGSDEMGMNDAIKDSILNKEINWGVLGAYSRLAGSYCADRKMLSQFRQVVSSNEVLFECISKDQYVKSSIAEMVKYCNTRRGANYGYAKPATALVPPILEEKTSLDTVANSYTRYLRSKLQIAGDGKNIAFFPCADAMKLYMQ